MVAGVSTPDGRRQHPCGVLLGCVETWVYGLWASLRYVWQPGLEGSDRGRDPVARWITARLPWPRLDCLGTPDMSGEHTGCFVTRFEGFGHVQARGLAVRLLGPRCGHVDGMDPSDGLGPRVGPVCGEGARAVLVERAPFALLTQGRARRGRAERRRRGSRAPVPRRRLRSRRGSRC